MSYLGKRKPTYQTGAYKKTRSMPRAMSKYQSQRPTSSRSLRVYQKETGYFDQQISTNLAADDVFVLLINDISQGAGTVQRVGKKITLRSLQLRGKIQPVDDTTTPCQFNYMIVYDKRPTGTLPSYTDILEENESYALTKADNEGRFTILKRRTDWIIGGTGELTSKSFFSEEWFLPMKNMPVVYKSLGTGGIGDIEQGALYFVAFGSNLAVNGGQMTARTRLRFMDN